MQEETLAAVKEPERWGDPGDRRLLSKATSAMAGTLGMLSLGGWGMALP